MGKFLRNLAVAVAMIGAGAMVATPVMAADNCNADGCVKTNLFWNVKESDTVHCYCPEDGSGKGQAILEILILVLNVLSSLVLIVAVAGIIISGIQYLTARDNDAQVAKAKMRILQIMLGLVAYAFMWAFLNWLVPGGLFKS